MSGTQGIRSGLARATQNVGNIIGDGRLEYLGIGLLFAVGGIWTKVVIDQRVPAGSGFPFVYATLVLAVAPFAAICALLFARTWRIIIAALLLGAVFLAAMTVAEFLAIKSAKRVSGFAFAMFSAGLIGGTGVVLSLAACNRSLLASRRVSICGGRVAGVALRLPAGLCDMAGGGRIISVRCLPA